MPWASRIQSESTRRVVIAAIMFVVLLASTALAYMLTESRTVRFSEHEVGAFRLILPQGWRQEAGDETERPRLTLEGGGQEFIIDVVDIAFPGPVSPSIALAQVRQKLVDGQVHRQQTEPVEADRVNGLLHMVGAVRRNADGQGVYESHLIALLTTDGERHLVVHLRLAGAADLYHIDLVRRIAASAADVRYQRIRGPRFVRDGIGLSIPGGAMVFAARQEEPGKLHAIPRKAGDFFVLRLAPGELPDELGEQWARPDGKTDDTAEVPVRGKLAAMIVERYQQITGRLPSRRSIQRHQAGEYEALALPVGLTRESGMAHELWAASINDTRALMIYLNAPADELALARSAAALFIAGMHSPAP